MDTVLRANQSQQGMHSKKLGVGFTVLVAGLGYFVDIYDLLLFGIVRVASLKGIGLPEKDFLQVGILLVNLQMIGMLFGGILWGILGDKKGRVSVLFGSILIYSIANILNAFVNSVEAYGLLRFLAGVGLAGELGAAITLVSETLSKEKRGLGTTIVSSVGILGAVFAGIVSDFFSWRMAYLIGGLMGLLLLMLRLSIGESGMFQKIQNHGVEKGDLRMLFHPRKRFWKYVRCIIVGVPIWYVIGILITFSPELGRELGVQGELSAGKAILFCYLGASIGNVVCGLLSQYLKSRKKVVYLFLALLMVLTGFCLYTRGWSVSGFYLLSTLLGFATGYWVVFMTIAAEQFGTNLRATVTTTVPNFVRASVVILTFGFHTLGQRLGLVHGAWIVGSISVILATVCLLWMNETFHRDLNFIELKNGEI